MTDREKPRVQLTVCATCTDTSIAGEAGLGAGARVLSMLRAALADADAEDAVKINVQRCLMACTEGCVATIAAEGKMQYLLGRLKPDEKLARSIIEFCAMYDASPTGVTPNHEWPGTLALHFLGRIPPPNPAEADWRDDGCNL